MLRGVSRRVVAGVAGVLAAVGLAGCGLQVDVAGVAGPAVTAAQAAAQDGPKAEDKPKDEDKPKPKAKAQDKDKDGSSSASPSPQESEPVFHRLGEETTGPSGIKVKVVKWDTPATVRMYKHDQDGGSEDTSVQIDYKPRPGYRWVRVETQLTNGTHKSIDVTCSAPLVAWLADTDGDQFDSMRSQYLVPGNPECNAGVQPTVTATMTWVFEVPGRVLPAGFIWRDLGDGFDSDPDGFFLYRF